MFIINCLLVKIKKKFKADLIGRHWPLELVGFEGSFITNDGIWLRVDVDIGGTIIRLNKQNQNMLGIQMQILLMSAIN